MDHNLQTRSCWEYPDSGGFAGQSCEADDGTRTHDLRLGKPTLYQLSYVRKVPGDASDRAFGAVVA